MSIRRTTAAYFIAFVGLGLMAGCLGPALDVLRDRSGTSLGTIAWLFTITSLGYLVGSIVMGRRYDRMDGHQLMAISIVGAAAGVSLLAVSHPFAVMGVAVLVMGLAQGGVDTGGNTLLTWLHPSGLAPRMIALHASFGVGAMMAPLVLAVSRVTTDGEITLGLLTIGAVMVVCAVRLRGLPSPRPATHGHGDAKPPATRRALVAVAFFYFVYVGVELGFIGWLFTFGVDRGFDEDTSAAWLVSAFWFAFTGGRLLGVIVARWITPLQYLWIDLGLTAAGALALGTAGDNRGAIVGATLLIGLAQATMYPAMMNLAGDRMAFTGTASAWFVGGSGAGGLLLPLVIGQLFDHVGSEVLPWFLLGSLALSAVTIVLADRSLPAPRAGTAVRTFVSSEAEPAPVTMSSNPRRPR
ncbi:MAG TPA: MFS transporter [Acidimicrobiales bacterium]